MASPIPTAPPPAYLAAAGQPEAAAPLAALPPGLALPADEPLWYDPARKVLLYRGHMCNATYHYLRGLSDDLAFGCAVDVLYQGGGGPAPSRPRGVLGLALGTAVAAGGAGAWWLLR